MFGFVKNIFVKNDNNELKEALKNDAFLVDVRTPAEFLQGSVRNAVNIPLDKLYTQLSKLKGKKSIVVFCRSGMRSIQAKKVLEQNNFQNVINGGAIDNVKKMIS